MGTKMFIGLMVSRLRRACAVALLLFASGFITIACQKVPLLAPTGSNINLTSSASPQTLPSTGGTSTITATVADSSGNLLPGVPVTFSIDTSSGSSGVGSLSATVINTDLSGHAQTTLTTNRTTVVSATAGVGA